MWGLIFDRSLVLQSSSLCLGPKSEECRYINEPDQLYRLFENGLAHLYNKNKLPNSSIFKSIISFKTAYEIKINYFVFLIVVFWTDSSFFYVFDK